MLKVVCSLCRKVLDLDKAIYVDGKVYHYPVCYRIREDLAKKLNRDSRWMVGKYED